MTNFGWPCYEGAPGSPSERLRLRQPVDLREPLRRRRRGGPGAASSPGTTAPWWCPARPARRQLVGAGHRLRPASGGNYPTEYDGALFFADYSRDCIWAMLPGAGRRAGSREDPHLRRRRRESGGPADRPRRRPLLPRLRRRHDQAGQLHLGESAADGGRDRLPDDRSGAADGPVQRLGLERPGRRRHAQHTPGTSTATASTTTRRRSRRPTRTRARASTRASLRVTDSHGASARPP